MLEVYAFVALAGAGYALAQRRANVAAPSPPHVMPPSSLPHYYAAAAAQQQQQQQRLRTEGRDAPSSASVYHSTRSWEVARQERAAAAAATAAARDPARTGVIPLDGPARATLIAPVRPGAAAAPEHTRFVRSGLTGLDVPVEQFTHNNMVPFFGGSVRQNVDPEQGGRAVDVLRGGAPLGGPKRESAPLFAPTTGLAHVFGAPPDQREEMRERILPGRVHNNVTPAPQVRVGPGILSFDAAPQDTTMEERAFIMPRSVDELRVETRPKLTYDGVVLDGQRGRVRAEAVPVAKRRPDTWFEQTPDMLLRTTGAVKADTQRAAQVVRDTTRPCTHVGYQGAAFAADSQAAPQRTDVSAARAPHRTPLAPMAPGPSDATRREGQGVADDHGRAAIVVYANERDVTTTRTHQSNLTSAVKALIAPLTDALRVARKEYTLDGGAAAGVNVRPQLPPKLTVYDPADVARTTLKESALDAAPAGNLRGGALKAVVYDPADVARTTIKQTGLDAAPAANLRGGALRSVVYDPADVARTTLKQTGLDAAPAANLRGGALRSVVYDPASVARTTVKETGLGEAPAGNLRGGALKAVAYDPACVTRTTVKETGLDEAPAGNLRGGAFKGTVFEPDAPARTTVKEIGIVDGTDYSVLATGERRPVARDPLDAARRTGKETLADATSADRNVGGGYVASVVYDADDVTRTTMRQTIEREARAGNVEALEGRAAGGYATADYDARTTVKETTLPEHARLGAPDRAAATGADGYKVAAFDAPATHKQELVDHAHVGVAADQGAKASTSLEAALAARVNERRQELLEAREPTRTAVKVAAGADQAPEHVVRRDALGEEAVRRLQQGRGLAPPSAAGTAAGGPTGATSTPALGGAGTRERQAYRIDDRLDIATLSALDGNPFALPRRGAQ